MKPSDVTETHDVDVETFRNDFSFQITILHRDEEVSRLATTRQATAVSEWLGMCKFNVCRNSFTAEEAQREDMVLFSWWMMFVAIYF